MRRGGVADRKQPILFVYHHRGLRAQDRYRAPPDAVAEQAYALVALPAANQRDRLVHKGEVAPRQRDQARDVGLLLRIVAGEITDAREQREKVLARIMIGFRMRRDARQKIAPTPCFGPVHRRQEIGDRPFHQ